MITWMINARLNSRAPKLEENVWRFISTKSTGMLKAAPRKKRIVVSRTAHFFICIKLYAVIRLRNANTPIWGGAVKLDATSRESITPPAII
ncbi:MAG: hypothetical protein JSW53_05100 [Candidatus Bathyarchaeota archaeon]|nr:MAG: hypothetical protein JSW53_05100 [Candidatus Bathyarchaeota archaeon]